MDGRGRTPLLEAAAAGAVDCLRFLASDGCGVPVRDEVAPGPECGATGERSGEHALLLAAAGGHAPAVDALLELGAKVNRVDASGRSALWVSAARGHAGVVRVLLGRRPAPKHIADFVHRRTPIQAAAANGHAGVVRVLAAALAGGLAGGQQPAGKRVRKAQPRRRKAQRPQGTGTL